MRKRRGIVLVLSAPSGAGKTTVVRRLMEAVDDARFSISYTTRLPRPNERDGVDYHFVSDDEFRAKVERGEFLEWAPVHGCLYGTGRDETEAVCASGLDIVLDIDVQGASQLRKSMPEAVSVFMLPPSFQELERRILGRGLDDDSTEIANRLRTARVEAEHYKLYHYVIVNDVVERSVELLKCILLAERTRSRLVEEQVKPILESFEQSP